MSAPEVPPASERWVCVKCTGVSGAHYLTCPTLRAPASAALRSGDGSSDQDVTG